MPSAGELQHVRAEVSALDLPLSVVLREVSDLVALEESLITAPASDEVVASAA